MQKMADVAWQAVGNVTNLSGVSCIVVSGGIASFYQSYCSPSTSLKQSEKALNDVKTRLQSLSPQRRAKIEAAYQSAIASGEVPQSLEDLEKDLEEYVMFIETTFLSSSNSQRSTVSLICTVD